MPISLYSNGYSAIGNERPSHGNHPSGILYNAKVCIVPIGQSSRFKRSNSFLKSRLALKKLYFPYQTVS